MRFKDGAKTPWISRDVFEDDNNLELGRMYINPSMTPTKHKHSLGRLGDKVGKRTQGACD
jgi:hypothetical protein